MSQKVSIIGAGFSGLSLAYYLNRAGFEVTVFEKTKKVGGLLVSPELTGGIVEHAANGIVLSEDLFNLCQDLDIKIIYPSQLSKNKYLFVNNKKTKWPLGFKLTASLIFKMIQFKLNKEKFKPNTNETLRQWGERVFNKSIVDSIIEPAFLGVYATPSSELSASLVTKNFFNKKNKSKNKNIKRQTVSFVGGMEGFCHEMYEKLQKRGVTFKLREEITQLNNEGFEQLNFICTDPLTASHLVKDVNQQLSKQLNSVNKVSIAKAACFSEHLPSDGFGCLFARNEKIKSLGVLFDSNLFSQRYKGSKLQTWIIGAPYCSSEKEVKQQVMVDFKLFWQKEEGQEIQELKDIDIVIWKNTLPKYDLQLEKTLNAFDFMQPIYAKSYLFTNYCGDIGLSQLLSKAKQITERVTV